MTDRNDELEKALTEFERQVSIIEMCRHSNDRNDKAFALRKVALDRIRSLFAEQAPAVTIYESDVQLLRQLADEEMSQRDDALRGLANRLEALADAMASPKTIRLRRISDGEVVTATQYLISPVPFAFWDVDGKRLPRACFADYGYEEISR